jgi:uncharacterized Zn-finger protein
MLMHITLCLSNKSEKSIPLVRSILLATGYQKTRNESPAVNYTPTRGCRVGFGGFTLENMNQYSSPLENLESVTNPILDGYLQWEEIDSLRIYTAHRKKHVLEPHHHIHNCHVPLATTTAAVSMVYQPLSLFRKQN